MGMSDRHVLLIEDNPVNQKLVTRYLTAKGYRVEGASNTAEADAGLAGGPGLVLVDVSLPGEDGLAWVERARQAGATMPMVALTAHVLPADRDRAIASGCQEFLTKPIELKRLVMLVERYLGPPSPRAPGP